MCSSPRSDRKLKYIIYILKIVHFFPMEIIEQVPKIYVRGCLPQHYLQQQNCGSKLNAYQQGITLNGECVVSPSIEDGHCIFTDGESYAQHIIE